MIIMLVILFMLGSRLNMGIGYYFLVASWGICRTIGYFTEKMND